MIKEVIYVWTEEIRQNLANELSKKLDDKTFFNIEESFTSIDNEKKIKNDTFKLVKIEKNSLNPNESLETAVKGIAFTNNIPVEATQNTIEDLSFDNRKIYKISDLISKNLVETVVIPIPENKKCTSLTVLKKFDWSEFLFSDLGTAWKMMKNRFIKS